MLPDAEVELTGEISAEVLAPYRERALASIAAEVELPGFRKGHVPADMALKKVGELAVLEEAVELAMRDLYPELLTAHKVDAVGRPNIAITKLAPNNPTGLTLTVATYPEVTLPSEWKQVGTNIEIETVADVLDAEVDEALESIRKARGEVEKKKAQIAGDSTEEQGSAVEAPLPELDDAFAQSLGAFTDLADLKVKLRENMQQEKTQKAREARRGKIIDELLTKITVGVPSIFVESELDKIMAQMKEDVTRFGMTVEDYLTRVGKTEEDVREEFRDQARKRATLQLTLNKIAEEEKLEADKEAVDAEMKHALEHFPDARPELVRIHIETVMRNEKVLQLLEGSLTETPAEA